MATCQGCGKEIPEGRVLCEACADRQAKEKPAEAPTSVWVEKEKKGRGRGIWVAAAVVLAIAIAVWLWAQFGPSRSILGEQGKGLRAIDLMPQSMGVTAIVDVARLRKEGPEGERMVKLSVESVPTRWRALAESLAGVKQVAMGMRLPVTPTGEGQAPQGGSAQRLRRGARAPYAPPLPSLEGEGVIIVEAPSSKAAKQIIPALQKGMGQEKPERQGYQGVDILKWRTPRLAAAALDQFVVIAERPEHVSEVVGIGTGGGQRGFGKSAAFAEAYKGLEMKPMLTLMALPDELMAPIRAAARGRGEPVPPEGLAQWLVAGADLDQKGVFFRALGKLGPAAKALPAGAPRQPLTPNVARWMPKEATLTMAAAQAGDSLRGMLDAMEQGSPEAWGEVVNLQAQLGLDFRRDLCSAMSGSCAFVLDDLSALPATGFPQGALVIETAPGAAPQVFDRLVAVFSKLAPGSVGIQPDQKRAVITINAGMGPAATMQVRVGMEATPGAIAIGLPPEFVTGLLQGLPEAKSLADFFKDKQIPQKAAALFYFNPASIMTFTAMQAGAGGREGAAAEKASKVLEAFGPMYAWFATLSGTLTESEGRMALDHKKLVSALEAMAKEKAPAKARR